MGGGNGVQRKRKKKGRIGPWRGDRTGTEPEGEKERG